MTNRNWLLLVLSLFSQQAFAGAIHGGVYSSPSTVQNSLDATYENLGSDEKPEVTWDVTGGLAALRSRKSDTITRDIFLNANLTTSSRWTFGLDLSSSRTESEDLSSFESAFVFSHKSVLGEKKDFNPTLTLGARLSRNFIVQNAATARTVRTFTLQQNAIKVFASWVASESWFLKTSLTKYRYDRDLRNLYAQLGRYPYLVELSETLSRLFDTVASLPESSLTFSLAYTLKDDLNFLLDLSLVKDFVSENLGSNNSLGLEWLFNEKWGSIFKLGATANSDTGVRTGFLDCSVSYTF